jgi:hypothetical protein
MRQVASGITSSSLRFLAFVVAATLLGGCQAIAVTAAGIGTSTGLSHSAGSVSNRTFTAPEPQVRHATLIALEKMGVKVETISRSQGTEVFRASMADRVIEIEIESLNALTTRINATAQRGLFVYDGATAREIVAQTELAMAELAQPRRARAPSKGATTSIANSTIDSPTIRR